MKSPALSAFAAFALLTASASAQILFNHLGTAPSKFGTDETILLRGSARRTDRYIRLTPSARIQRGAAWLSSKQDVSKGFSTMFQFRITDPRSEFTPDVTTSTGGDGFAFVIQNASPGALGYPGGGIGYAGISNSVAIEFDTWDNDESGQDVVRDVNDNHVAVHTLGTESNLEYESYALGVTPNVPEMTDGEVHTVRIEYVPGNLYVYMDDVSTPILAVQLFLDEVMELDEGKAWVGFTSATWSAYENHDILNWAFSCKTD